MLDSSPRRTSDYFNTIPRILEESGPFRVRLLGQTLPRISYRRTHQVFLNTDVVRYRDKDWTSYRQVSGGRTNTIFVEIHDHGFRQTVKICIVSSIGGHLTEVRAFRAVYERHSHFYVLNAPTLIPEDMGGKTYFI